MTNHKFGTTTWDEETGGKRATSNDKRDTFMRLQPGSNIVRVVTKPHLYLSHKYKEAGDPGFGEKIMCSAPLHKTCAVCDLGKDQRAKKRWFVGVIDRKTNTYKVLDIGVTIYDALKSFNRDEDYGDPTRYDINIEVDPKAAPANYYGVIPKPPKPLSEQDLVLKAQASEEDLDRRCQPPTPEWVLSRLNTILEKKGKAPVGAKVAAAQPAQVDMSDDVDASDVDFPVAN